jgi:enoyl-CoA hydratase
MINAKIDDNTLCIEFDDPGSRNSFSLKAAEALAVALQSGSYDSVIFQARARVFCSGGNLSDYAAMKTADPGKEVNRKITEILTQLSQLPVPTFCLISGDCFGGGLELMSAFDFIYSSPHAVFGFWQRKIALTFGWGGGARIEARLGKQKTNRLSLSAGTIGAQEALSIGLIDELHLAEKLETAAKEKIKSLRNLPTTPLSTIKAASEKTEQEKFEELWWNPEHLKILTSRKP